MIISYPLICVLSNAQIDKQTIVEIVVIIQASRVPRTFLFPEDISRASQVRCESKDRINGFLLPIHHACAKAAFY